MMQSQSMMRQTPLKSSLPQQIRPSRNDRVGLPHRNRLLRAAAGQEEPSSTENKPEQTTGAAPSNPPRVNAVQDPSVARGQRTAIVTGAISIIFGVAYLALVQFMDMRGGELLPPPPEAYLP